MICFLDNQYVYSPQNEYRQAFANRNIMALLFYRSSRQEFQCYQVELKQELE